MCRDRSLKSPVRIVTHRRDLLRFSSIWAFADQTGRAKSAEIPIYTHTRSCTYTGIGRYKRWSCAVGRSRVLGASGRGESCRLSPKNGTPRRRWMCGVCEERDSGLRALLWYSAAVRAALHTRHRLPAYLDEAPNTAAPPSNTCLIDAMEGTTTAM